uniref:Myb/SANT-like DNA-binding domain-containing protein 4 n=1 Tax=Gouania willdenowi TaxID=441366 RepID=A0A8C5G545_GOUWI
MSSPVYYTPDSFTQFRKRKARFTFSEVHILLDEVRRHRKVVVGKYNRGVATDIKKQTWATITARVNEIGECQREVMEVIKKWSDLKCDTKRKVAALRYGKPANKRLRARLSRGLSQTEKIVMQILDMEEEDQPTADFGPVGDDEDLPGRPDDQSASSLPPPVCRLFSVVPLFLSADTEPAFGESDDDQREDMLPRAQTVKLSEDRQVNNGVQKQEQLWPPVKPLGSEGNTRDCLLQNASLSVQEQHTTNMLLETVSRSLELLSESVQQLVETQQEFVRESLQLQRETVQVLRDFTGGAIALMHDKLNGRPPV